MGARACVRPRYRLGRTKPSVDANAPPQVKPDLAIRAALVEAYSKAGEWDRAEAALREAGAGEGGDLLPVHTYNTLIGELGRGGCADPSPPLRARPPPLGTRLPRADASACGKGAARIRSRSAPGGSPSALHPRRAGRIESI